MSRISGVRRMLHVIAATVFVLAAHGEAFGLHRPCPHHEGGHGGTDAVLVEHGSDGHADHASHAPADAGEDADHGPCSCLGSCVVGASASVPAGAEIETLLVEPDAAPRIVPDVLVPAPAGPGEHRLPFPNGPPLV